MLVINANYEVYRIISSIGSDGIIRCSVEVKVLLSELPLLQQILLVKLELLNPLSLKVRPVFFDGRLLVERRPLTRPHRPADLLQHRQGKPFGP